MPFGEFLVKYSAGHRQQGIDWGSVFNRTYSGRRTGYPGTRFCPQGRERFPARRFLRWRLPSRNGDGATQQIRHRYAVGRCLLLCIGCTAFGRFRRVALGPGVHGIGAERRVYSSVSFRSSKSVPRTCSVPSFPSLLRVFPGFPLMLAESPLPLSFYSPLLSSFKEFLVAPIVSSALSHCRNLVYRATDSSTKTVRVFLRPRIRAKGWLAG